MLFNNMGSFHDLYLLNSTTIQSILHVQCTVQPLLSEPAGTVEVWIIKSSDNQGHIKEIEILLMFSLYSIINSHNSYNS